MAISECVLLRRSARLFGLFCIASAISPLSALSQDFYAGKTITIVVGYGGGSGYDRNARFIARHLPEHLPGSPIAVVQNMPGAGTLTATNHVANLAPKDGTVLGLVARGMGLEPLLGGKNVRYDPLKLKWIGSTSREVSIIAVRAQTGVETLKDAKQRELAMAATAAGTDGVTFPLALNNLLGTRFKPVMGYKSGAEMTLAVERGEVDGRGSWSWASFRQESLPLLKSGALNILVQMSARKAPDLPDVPLVTELVTGRDRDVLNVLLAGQAMAWPLFAPAETPAERVQLLRKAYLEMLKRPAAIAEAEKLQIDIDPVAGEEITELLEKVYATPSDVVEQARELTGRS